MKQTMQLIHGFPKGQTEISMEWIEDVEALVVNADGVIFFASW
jgi:hypothetical protein